MSSGLNGRGIGIVCLLFFVMGWQKGVSQSYDFSPDPQQVVQVPLSPEAAAFTKYGEVPVSLYTGTPNISVPIYTIQGREMALPITMTYDASGIRVDQIATWVGLGWNLNAGGAVTRQVNGLPDGYPHNGGAYNGRIYDTEMQDFLAYAKENHMVPETEHPQNRLAKLFQIEDHSADWQEFDLQPDLFSFSINGLSGTLYINYHEMTAYCIDNPNLKVSFEFDDLAIPMNQLLSWEIVGEDGTTYRFASREITHHTFEAGALKVPHVHEYTSAWYISEIISSSQRDHIEFYYSGLTPWNNQEPLIHTLSGRTASMQPFGPNNVCDQPPGEIGSNYDEYYIDQFYLESIHLNGKQVAFFTRSAADRADMFGRKKLDKMEFYDLTGNSLLSIAELQHSYFGDPTNLTHPNSQELVRLKLDKIVFKPSPLSTHSVYNQEYSFDYHRPEDIPKRHSTGVDYWGFYNGRDQNPDLVPSLTLDDGTRLTGAYRFPSLEETQIGTLYKIHYPTGGHTEFSYSLHTIPPNSNHYFEEVPLLLAQVQGGLDPSNPYNFNDWDAGYPFTQAPNGDDGDWISKAEDQPSRILLELTGQPASSSYYQVIVYKSGPVSCVPFRETEYCDPGTEQDFADLSADNLDPDQEVKYFGNPFENGNTVFELSMAGWDPGAYRILVLNATVGTNVIATVYETVATTQQMPQFVGGLRTYKVADRPKDGEEASVRYFYYNDLSTLSASGINPQTFQGFYIPSGVNHVPLRFHNFSYSRACNDQSGQNEYECTTLTRFASNLARPVGPHIAYTLVSEVQYSPDEGINGFTVHEYFNDPEFITDIPFPKRKLLNGQLKQSRVFDQVGNLLAETINDMALIPLVNPDPTTTLGMVIQSNTSVDGVRYYETTPTAFFGIEIDCKPPTGDWNPLPNPCYQPNTVCVLGVYPLNSPVLYDYSRFWTQMKKTTSIQYLDNIGVSTTTDYVYGNPVHRQVTETSTTNSDGTVMLTKSYYPDDVHSLAKYSTAEKTVIDQLNSDNLHRIALPIYVEQFVDGERVLVEKSNFGSYVGYYPFSTRILPSSVENSNGEGDDPGTEVDESVMKTIIVFHAYDKSGNLVEVSRESGTHMAYFYGENFSRPLAKVVNATYAEVTAALGVSNFTEHENVQLLDDPALRTKLNDLRGLSNTMVSTYTYGDGFGVSSMTDPNNRTLSYTYDAYGRLVETKDHNGNVRQLTTYHLAN